MAATVTEFDHTKQLIREFGLSGRVLRLALVDSTYVLDVSHVQWSQISAAEIAGTGYVAGGKALASIVFNADGSIDAADVFWDAATMTFRMGILYVDGTVDGKINPPLAAYLYNDAPADISVVATKFTHVIDSAGIIT